MGASRRARRAQGRVLAAPKRAVKGGVGKVSRAASRRAGKAALLAAARTARTARARAPPRLLALVPLCPRAAGLAEAAAALRAADPAHTAALLEVPRDAVSTREWTLNALDAAKVADVLVLVFGAGGIDEEALPVLAAIRAQGLPAVVAVAVGDGAGNALVRRRRGRELAAESLGDDAALRPFDVSNEDGRSRALRRCVEGAAREISWRKRYGYMHVSRAVLGTAEAEAADDGTVCLDLAGVVRGAGLSANQLMMITGIGAFKVLKIVRDNMDGQVLGVRSEEHAEPIESEAPDDGLGGEQTWPPEVADEQMAEEPVRKVRVPKGFSEYQAAWLPDVEEASGDDKDEYDLETASRIDVMIDAVDSPQNSPDDEEVNTQTNEVDEGDDMEVDAAEVERVRAAARIDAEFPDEVDTPMDTPARVRFGRYRGLKSFRTSPWDPKEQLPRSYARLFQFADLAATRKSVLAEAESATLNGKLDALAGEAVIVTLSGVARDVAEQVVSVVAAGRTPVVLSSMLRHENRQSVVHFGLQRVDGEEGGVIKAKSPLEIHCGFVRFMGRPMFSEQNANSDKHKMERFFVHGRYIVCSFFGPAVYAPAPALLFQPGGDLVATGSTLGADPDRIVLKRIVLTGYPFKTQKKRTVVKFMFFNPEDVRWFRPVELWTKLGRTGHIVEPLGTHGRMKCIFDAPILHHDTVCLTLYKRVYPKHLKDSTSDDGK